ncbi:hypothetical protein FEP68_04508 [Burkholderia multivorans]|nr:hypothetical protein [Burkholderia multivorans]
MNMDNVVYAVVDDGFRQSKGMTSEGFKGAVPSVARSGYTLSSIGEDDSGSGGYESEGLQYTVDASIDGEDTRYNDYAFTPINRVLVNHVLQLAGLGGKDVVLATGLPFQTYFRQGGTDVNQDILERKMANLAIEVRPLNGKEPPRIMRQTVVAQGVAAVIDYLTDDQGNIRSDIDPEAPLAVVDVGGAHHRQRHDLWWLEGRPCCIRHRGGRHQQCLRPHRERIEASFFGIKDSTWSARASSQAAPSVTTWTKS